MYSYYVYVINVFVAKMQQLLVLMLDVLVEGAAQI